MAAAIIGWNIGTWLRDNFLEARLAGIALVEGLLVGWERVKEGAQVLWLYVKKAAEEALVWIEKKIGDLASAMATVIKVANPIAGAMLAAPLKEVAASFSSATSEVDKYKTAIKGIHDASN